MIAQPALFSPNVIDKARGLIASGHVAEAPHPDLVIIEPADVALRLFHVTSGENTYRVRTDGATWATCSCPHGQHTDSMVSHCSHVVAVLLLLQEET